jgi:hypothetical protein
MVWYGIVYIMTVVVCVFYFWKRGGSVPGSFFLFFSFFLVEVKGNWYCLSSSVFISGVCGGIYVCISFFACSCSIVLACARVYMCVVCGGGGEEGQRKTCGVENRLLGLDLSGK